MKKVLLFQPSCPNRQYCKLGAKKFLPFLLMFVHQLRRIITGRHIRNDFFFDSFFFTWVITQQTFVLMKTSWRRLEDVFRLHLQKTSARRLDQDEYIRLTRLQKTSLRRLVKTNIFVLVIRFQDVFNTSSRRFGRCKIVTLKKYWRRLQDQQIFAGN